MGSAITWDFTSSNLYHFCFIRDERWKLNRWLLRNGNFVDDHRNGTL
jgi:hypothetical protein